MKRQNKLILIILLTCVIASLSIVHANMQEQTVHNESILHGKTVVDSNVIYHSNYKDIITVKMLPSCSRHTPNDYYYSTHSWIDECPYCGGHLLINPKGVPEGELTCVDCGSDWCGVDGFEKYSWSHMHLTRA